MNSEKEPGSPMGSDESKSNCPLEIQQLRDPQTVYRVVLVCTHYTCKTHKHRVTGEMSSTGFTSVPDVIESHLADNSTSLEEKPDLKEECPTTGMNNFYSIL